MRSLGGDQLCAEVLRSHALDRDDAMLVHVSYSLD